MNKIEILFIIKFNNNILKSIKKYYKIDKLYEILLILYYNIFNYFDIIKIYLSIIKNYY